MPLLRHKNICIQSAVCYHHYIYRIHLASAFDAAMVRCISDHQSILSSVFNRISA